MSSAKPGESPGNKRASPSHPQWKTLWALMFFLLCVIAAPACQPEPAPLLTLLGTAPDQVDLGQRFEILGRELPAGIPARLSLEGAIYRPGCAPREGVRLEAMATSVPDRATVFVSSELYRQLVGEGPCSRRATLRGTATLSYGPSRGEGIPAVVGRLEPVTLNVRGNTLSPEEETRVREEAARFLRYLGAALEPDTVPLTLESITPKSLAAQSGLLAGDQLLELDHVNLFSPTDLVPRNDSLESSLLVRRGEGAEPQTVLVPTSGYHQIPPRRLSLALVLSAALTLALGLAWLTPLGKGLRWLAAQLALRLRDDPPWRYKLTASIHGARRQRPRAFIWLAHGIVTLACTWLFHLQHPNVGAMLALFAFVLSLTGALFFGGSRAKATRWRLRRALSFSIFALLHFFLLSLSLGQVLWRQGTIDLGRVASLQGAAPWHWNAFSTPLSFLAWLLFLAFLVPSYAPRSNAFDAGQAGQFGREASGLDSVVLSLWSVLGAVVFWGAWPVATGTLPSQALGVLVCVAKCFVIFGLGTSLRVAVRHASVTDCGHLLLSTLPLGLGLVLLTPYWDGLGITPHLSDLLRITLASTSVLLLVMALFWAWRAKGDKRLDPTIQPWV